MNAIDPRSPMRARALPRIERGRAPSLLDRMLATPGHRVLDWIDRGLTQGRLDAVLPDGSHRTLGGRAPGPACDVHLRHWAALVRLAVSGSAGWYRAWAAAEWTSPDPVPLFELFMLNAKALGDLARPSGTGRWLAKAMHWARRNNRTGSRRNIAFHYDLGNDFYALWLDEGMHYSSALFQSPGDREEKLEQAQLRKIDAVIDRLKLSDGASLLEIGCGWGGLGERAMERHGVRYTGLTLSAEQQAYARERLGSGAQVSLTDYRDATGTFDAIASVEMVEAVGQRFWPDYVAAIRRLLKPGGRAGIQYILIDDAIFANYARGVDFIQTYVFPGGMLMSRSRFRALVEAKGLAWEDEHSFAADYAETLRRWRARFDVAIEQGRLPASFDQRFVGLWRYYLMYCEGGFRSGSIDVAQVTLVKPA